jgi:carotenoid cleavage dioxygenase-like enzyme
MSPRFPARPYLTAHFAPISFEADAADLPIWDEVPKDLCGTLYHNGPNPQFARPAIQIITGSSATA